MIILGICGRAKHGKNVTATAIRKKAVEFGFNHEQIKEYEISNYVLADLQRHGTLVGRTRSGLAREELKKLVDHGLKLRKQDPHFWLDLVFEDMQKDNPLMALVPNIRFLNEAEAIRNVGTPGRIVRVKTLIRDGVEYISEDRNPNDDMETENYRIEADYFLTVKRGQTKLLQKQAAAIFDYILHEAQN
jgi:hypothetical protein